MSRVGHLDVLARRVRWLDRYRRLIAIACAVLVAPFLMTDMSALLDAGWPRFHATALSIVVGFVVWCAVEVCLAWITAIWETEHYRLQGTRGLPRAELLQRKR